MQVFAIVPVFNRLRYTQTIVDCLRKQLGVKLQIIIVDDGSTDGTEEYLENQSDVTVFRGDGNLWWAGAVDLALRQLLPIAADDDYFLFVNDDTTFDEHFTVNLVKLSQRLGQGVIGGVLRDINSPHEILSIGPKIDIWRMRVWDILHDLNIDNEALKNEMIFVDALPGRGTLYPKRVFDRIGTMRTWCLPHYHADYELAIRAKKSGFPLAVSMGAPVYSVRVFGNDSSRFGWWKKKFSRRSGANILRYLCFYSMVGSWQQRVTAIPRFIYLRSRVGINTLKKLLRERRFDG